MSGGGGRSEPREGMGDDGVRALPENRGDRRCICRGWSGAAATVAAGGGSGGGFLAGASVFRAAVVVGRISALSGGSGVAGTRQMAATGAGRVVRGALGRSDATAARPGDSSVAGEHCAEPGAAAGASPYSKVAIGVGVGADARPDVRRPPAVYGAYAGKNTVGGAAPERHRVDAATAWRDAKAIPPSVGDAG